MKNAARYLSLIALIFFAIQACKKSGVSSSSSAGKGKLVVSRSSVFINQPDSVVLPGVTASDVIKWDVSPAGSSYLVTKNNMAMIIFNKKGTYKLSVSANGALADTGSIAVTDSASHPGTQYTYTPFTGDQITLVPYFYKSASADSSYLKFIAQTKNSYCQESDMHVAYSFTGGNYSIGFLDVVEPSPCPLGDGPLGWEIDFTTNATGPVANGTYPLSVTLNDVTYTGSIVVTSSTITYNWNYTSGVLISPKQISR